MDGDLSASSSTQRAKFNIDLEQLGVFLADAFVRRIDAFMPTDRITILKACRERLIAEGGDLVEYLLAGPSYPQTPQSVPSKPLVEQAVIDKAAGDRIASAPSVL